MSALSRLINPPKIEPAKGRIVRLINMRELAPFKQAGSRGGKKAAASLTDEQKQERSRKGGTAPRKPNLGERRCK